MIKKLYNNTMEIKIMKIYEKQSNNRFTLNFGIIKIGLRWKNK